jgi:phosphate:Na+ symporter
MVQSGVQRAFGATLRTFLAHHLRTRRSSFLSGLAITAALQSSTATALMTTRFARQGLITLVQGLAVMLGANVGSTLIVQLLSFDVLRTAPLLVLAGYLLFQRARAEKKDFGRVLIGLGLILFALHQFMILLDPLTANEGTREFLASLSAHTFLIVLAGALLTCAAHSSVAIVLLAMSFVTHGAVTLPGGLALVLGANLGTAINPLFESGSDSPEDRRLPAGNLLNRLVGVLLVLSVFPLVPPLLSSFDADGARAVADFHTAFNLLLALIFYPLLAPYARVIERLLPAKPKADSPDAPRFLQAAHPEEPITTALAGATREALRLADILELMLTDLRGVLLAPNRRQIEDARQLDDRLDGLTRAIKENLLAIPPDRLNDRSHYDLARILSFSINLEHAGDLIDRGLLEIANRRLKRGISANGASELIAMVDQLLAILKSSGAVFLCAEADAARRLAEQKQMLREADERALDTHFDRVRSGDIEAIESSALHLDALRDLRQIGNHLIEGAAYPILKEQGALLPTRLKAAL